MSNVVEEAQALVREYDAGEPMAAGFVGEAANALRTLLEERKASPSYSEFHERNIALIPDERGWVAEMPDGFQIFGVSPGALLEDAKKHIAQ